MTPYVSLDIETTGLDPSYCQVLEVAAVIDDWTSPRDELSRFHCFVVNDRIVGEPYALAMNAKLLEIIAGRKQPGLYLEPCEVLNHMANWLADKGFDTRNVLAAGKNFAGFDLRFLSRLAGYGTRLKFHHRFLDPAMLYWQPDTDQTPPNMETCLRRAGLHTSVSHRAMDDANDVVNLLRLAVKKPKRPVALLRDDCVLHLAPDDYEKVLASARRYRTGAYQESSRVFCDWADQPWLMECREFIGRENVDAIQSWTAGKRNRMLYVVRI